MSSLVSSLNIIELNEDTLLAMVKNVETHAVVLWRDQGLSSPDAKLNAFLDAAKQFENQNEIKWGYLDTHSAGLKWFKEKMQVAVSPTVHYFAPGQSEPRGVVLPMGYSNPNIMEGIVIDPGFIANRLRGALMEAEQRTREAACSDSESVCSAWAKAGECTKNPDFMFDTCKRSCLDEGLQEACPGVKSTVLKLPKCFDQGGANCASWAAGGQCESNAGYMLEECKFSCKICKMDEEDKERDMKVKAQELGNKHSGSAGLTYRQQVERDRENEQRAKSTMRAQAQTMY